MGFRVTGIMQRPAVIMDVTPTVATPVMAFLGGAFLFYGAAYRPLLSFREAHRLRSILAVRRMTSATYCYKVVYVVY